MRRSPLRLIALHPRCCRCRRPGMRRLWRGNFASAALSLAQWVEWSVQAGCLMTILSLPFFWGSTMAVTAAQVEQQRKQAEELLFSGPQTLGFAKGLFFGHFNAPLLFPYPQLR